MTGLRHIGGELNSVMLEIGMRAIGYHMSQARRLNGSSRFGSEGRPHVQEALGIYRSMQRSGIVFCFSRGEISPGNDPGEQGRKAP